MEGDNPNESIIAGTARIVREYGPYDKEPITVSEIYIASLDQEARMLLTQRSQASSAEDGRRLWQRYLAIQNRIIDIESNRASIPMIENLKIRWNRFLGRIPEG